MVGGLLVHSFYASCTGEGHPLLQQRVKIREVPLFRSHPPTKAERQAAIDLAHEVSIINPHTCIVMKHSQVCAGFSVVSENPFYLSHLPAIYIIFVS